MSRGKIVTAFGLALSLSAFPVAANAKVSYTYDPQGRIVTATYDNGTVIQYTYDDAGNITSRQIICGSSNGC